MADVNSKEAVITVTKQFSEKGRVVAGSETREVMEILDFETDHVSSTSIKLGMTVIPVRYESCRIDVMATVPHYEEERDQAFSYLLEKVERNLQLVVGCKEELTDLSDRIRETIHNARKTSQKTR
jgi:hypothetical protein